MRPPAGPGETVAPFTLLTFPDGRPVTWRPGRVTVLSFCALWCDTWREQSRRLDAVQARLAGLPVGYVTVSVDGRWAERFPTGAGGGGVLLDVGGQVSAGLGLRAVPWTLVVDARGVIRSARQGIVRTDELELLLRSLATGRAAPMADTNSPGDIYLSFDDFPTPTSPGNRDSPDELLLDILRAGDAPCTFFCICEHLTRPAGAATARRAAREGHSLQLHSWDHDATRPDLPRCLSVLRGITDTRPTLYRPPGSTELRDTNNSTIVAPRRAVIAPFDHTRPGVAETVRRVLFAARAGAVIALHAGVADTRAALPAILAGLRNRGLRFATL